MKQYDFTQLQDMYDAEKKNAQIARSEIKKERDRHTNYLSSFDVGFQCGLSFALGAFGGVCEEEKHDAE